MENVFVCSVCGHIEFGRAPETCPVCDAPREKFSLDNAAIHPAEREGKEKHVPVILVTEQCGFIPNACRDVHVKVGSVPHPMEEKHWIQWIDVYLDRVFAARYQMAPQALQAAVSLHVKTGQHGALTAVEHCNVHGTWMAESAL